MQKWLESLRGGELIAELTGLSIILILAGIVYFFAKWAFLRAVRRFISATETSWDDELVRAGVFSKVAYVAPVFVVYYGMGFLTELPEIFIDQVRRIAVALMILIGALGLTGFLAAAERIYDSHEEYRERPIKSYLQVSAILVYLLAGLLVLSVLMQRSPWIFVSGIGAMAAVLLLIFRDTILSFVASIQIASNDMIRVGDWIEMPDLGADGDVIDVALHTVKVQNWDKTITTIPTSRLISESFKNWRGMSLSGGRRIKRSVSLDLQSVHFLSDEEIDRFGKWSLLRDYVCGKKIEISAANSAIGAESEVLSDQRRLTNLGTFRAWIWATLREHPKIHQTGQTLLVRQLPSGPQGVPIEVYCFSTDTDWIAYENIQADLFDRILAIVPEFGLRIFQEPTGSDFGLLANQIANQKSNTKSEEGETR